MAAMGLQQAMWAEEARECAIQGQAAAERLAAAQSELASAESELNRVQLEGPANHRKRDPIDKVRFIRSPRGHLHTKGQIVFLIVPQAFDRA
jgi:hypothetical protein